MRLLVDGDIIVFRAGFACEKTAYFITHDGISHRFQYKKELDKFRQENNIAQDAPYETDVELEPVGNALHTVKLMLESVKDSLQSDDLHVFLSGPTNFRYNIATIKPYKGNRDAAHRPTHEQAIKDFLVREYGATYSVDEECDDVLGYTQYGSWINEQDSCIVSLDKDLRMIPGYHFNFVKETYHYIDIDEANRIFWQQLVTGDPTDNILGIKGAGPKAAQRLVSDSMSVEEYQQNVANAYKDTYGPTWRDAMLENGRLLWIRRHRDEWWNIPERIS